MAAARDLTKVLDEILALVPETELALRAQLTSLRETVLYQPPELAPNMWHRASAILELAIPRLEQEWQIAVARVFAAKEEEANGS